MTQQPPTTYTARWMFDGSSDEPLEHASITVADGRILEVGSVRAGTRTKDVIELGESTLLPGLIDAHVHLAWNASGAPHEEVLLDASGPRTVLRMAARAGLMLQRGTTTARDLGATDSLSIPLAEAISAGEIPGPRLLAAGRAIAMTGGHAHQIAVEADGPDGIRRAVREEIKRGATAIKFMASGGVYDRTAQIHQPQLTLEELTAGVEETHKANLVAAAHAYTPGPINTALDAGIDTIEHGSFLDAPTARRMRDLDRWWVPTMMASDLIVRRAATTNAPAYMRRKGEAVRDAVRSGVQEALAIGTPIAGGSDSGGAGIEHGRLPYEARLLTECGATVLQAIRICTLNSARALGIADEVGSLEVGKQADVLAVIGNATTEIGALERVRLVLKSGRLVG